MKATFHEPKPLIVLTADTQQKQTVATLLSHRWQSLGIRQIQAEIFSHPRHDPGVYHDAGNFLAPFAKQYSHALVLIDAEWGGSPLDVAKIKKRSNLIWMKMAGKDEVQLLCSTPNSKFGCGINLYMFQNC